MTPVLAEAFRLTPLVKYFLWENIAKTNETPMHENGQG